MSIYRKLQYYRYCLQIFLVLNVVVLLAGAFAAFHFFGQHRGHTEAMTLLWQQSQQTQTIKAQLVKLLMMEGQDSETLYQKRRLSDTIIEAIKTLNPTENPLPIEQSQWFARPILKTAQIQEINSYLDKRLLDTEQKIKYRYHYLGNVDLWMIITALLTFVIGIVIPALVFYRLGQTLQKARRDLEVQLRNMIHEWFNQYQEIGEGAYTQAIFWLNLLLIGVENFGRKSSHPLWQILAEITPIVRRELDFGNNQDTNQETSNNNE